MHDDDLHPDHELASAYLDGDVTEVQRAQVEASPELSALVATMRDMRSQLSDVPPASAAAREAALAAMLAEFDAPSSGADEHVAVAAASVAPPSNVVSLASRRQWPKRVMSAAAGLLVVGAVGVAIKGGLGGSTSDSKASSATAPANADMTAGGNAPEVAGGPPATIGSIMAPADVAVEIDDPQALLAYANEQWSRTNTKVASTPEGTDGTDAAGTTGTAGMSADTFVPTVVMVTGTLPPEISNCVTINLSSTYLGVITYRGILAYVVRDPDSGVITALTENCFVAATATP